MAGYWWLELRAHSRLDNRFALPFDGKDKIRKMSRSTIFARLWGLIILLFAALALTFLLEAGRGLAAPKGQTSPLPTAGRGIVSPVQTPTSIPTPTPTATSPVPPTTEPPSALLAWPTPTPYPAPVQAAIDLLTGDSSLGVSAPEFSARLLVDDPVTGEELTLVRLSDPATGTGYWLSMDSEGVSALLPDWGEDAVAKVAESGKLKPADFKLVNSFYIPFPFTRQIVWAGQIEYTTGIQYSIALDLAGDEMDQETLSIAEATAQTDYCGKIEAPFCLEIFDADPSAASDAVLGMEDGADSKLAKAFLEENETVFVEKENGELAFRMGNDALRELAQIEGVDFIQKGYPDELRPLDTNLIIGLVEQSGVLSLTVESQKLYPLLTYQVQLTLEKVEVTGTQGITLLTQIEGILAPANGPTSLTPAQTQVALGKLSGRFNLALAYTDPDRELDLQDNYVLIVSDGRAVIRAGETTFSWAKYPTWLRLPANALWFVVQARAADASGVAYATDADEFADKAEAFYAEVAGLRARELQLAEGIYTNSLFIPPWTTWQIPDGEQVRIPVNENQAYLFRWPDIRYFTYSGNQSALEAVITEHCVDEVAIVGYTAQGAVLDVCQP